MGWRVEPHSDLNTVPVIQVARATLLAIGLITGGNLPSFAETLPLPTQSVAPLPDAGKLPVSGSLAELAAQFERSPDTVVAEVDGTPITLGMVADRLHEFPEKFAVLPAPLIYKAATDDLIQQRALAVKAKQLGLEKLPATRRHLAESEDRALGQALVRQIAPDMVTDKAIEDRYNATVAGQPGPEEVQFRLIATATEADAKIVLDVLSKGSDFGALARKVSKDASAFNGGEIGYARRDKLTPEIGAVVFALAPGQMTAFPVRANGLWFILQVEGRRQQGTPTLAEAKAALTTELLRIAAAEVLQKSRAAVVVKDYGPTGMQGHVEPAASKSR